MFLVLLPPLFGVYKTSNNGGEAIVIEPNFERIDIEDLEAVSDCTNPVSECY